MAFEQDIELDKLVEELEKEYEVRITEIEKECCGRTYMVDCPGITLAVKPSVVELTFLNLPRVIVSYAEFYSAEKAIEFINICKNI